MIPIFIALGSNLGDRAAHLQQALHLLTESFELGDVSPIYETKPAYVLDQPRFLNVVCAASTDQSPQATLYRLLRIEQQLGRQRQLRFGPRLIDLDLLFYGDRILNTPDLILPHPRLAERGFVLVPLADIAPDWIHPVLGVTVATLLQQLGDVRGSVWPAAEGVAEVRIR